eukprot:TRINITY_DN7397_c0_g1_i1.p1 TRINITY_DN7397_c0_g1~~TRINITY_DN7397_c0_g1_i1.p1  ORF type:complete len:332 (+),score=24.64 TRINITY_DN7397_c0_g1_i1:89-1084(+)
MSLSDISSSTEIEMLSGCFPIRPSPSETHHQHQELTSIIDNEPSIPPEMPNKMPEEPPVVPCYIWFPYGQIIIILVSVVMLVISLAMNRGVSSDLWMNVNVSVLDDLGGAFMPRIVDQYQVWRLFTAVFLHVGFIHLGMNLLSLVSIGLKVEANIGHVSFLIVYFGSALTGTIASCIFLPQVLSVGASTSIFGLFALWFVDLYINWQNAQGAVCLLVSLLVSVMISLCIGLLPVIDNFAHLGGFFGGLFISMIILPSNQPIVVPVSPNPPSYRSHRAEITRRILGLLGITLYLGFGLYFLYAHVDINNECKWCEYISCIPIEESWCPELSN